MDDEYLVETIDRDEIYAKILVDPDPESPRNWDNLGTMLCFHSRYDLGDHHDEKSDDFSGWGDIEDYLITEKGAVIVRPLYLYDHSGLRIKIGSFAGLLPGGHAHFDSGQVGFIYVTREAILNEYGKKRISKQMIEKANKILEGEVNTYDDYLIGDIYGYEIYRKKSCPECGTAWDVELDSCWGYYGLDYTRKEVEGLLDHFEKQEKEEDKEQEKVEVL